MSIDHRAKATAVATFGVLLLSVTYEWGYFNALGSEFQTLASTSDYFSNAVEWIPTACVIVVMPFLREG